MIDKDGIERPDKFDGNILEIKNTTRKIKFDDKYNFKPRNIFFRMWAAFFRALAICFFNPYMVFKFKMKKAFTKGNLFREFPQFNFVVSHLFLFIFILFLKENQGKRDVLYRVLEFLVF